MGNREWGMWRLAPGTWHLALGYNTLNGKKFQMLGISLGVGGMHGINGVDKSWMRW
jgi:hypothetical protein